MRRREFITLIGGAAVWPLAASAQQAEPVRLIGMISGFSDAEMQPLVAAFRLKLQRLGWVEGRNVAIEVRTTSGDLKRLAEEARTLINKNVSVIVAMGTPGLNAVQQHSRTVPVVFALVADPVRLGLIESLSHPGGYATGFTNFEFAIGGKWLELVREIDPSIRRVTLLANPANSGATLFAQYIENAGRATGIDIETAYVRDSSEISAAIMAAARQTGGALIAFPDSLTVVHRNLIIGMAAQHRLPAIYPFRIFAMSGGLLSYGLDFPELYRQAAVYVDRILKGEKPADLPVQAPTKYELVINLKTAKALGLVVPPALLTSADEVIE
jgi:putative tryptophan/tyrosine transport system substrate-binding protein